MNYCGCPNAPQEQEQDFYIQTFPNPFTSQKPGTELQEFKLSDKEIPVEGAMIIDHPKQTFIPMENHPPLYDMIMSPDEDIIDTVRGPVTLECSAAYDAVGPVPDQSFWKGCCWCDSASSSTMCSSTPTQSQSTSLEMADKHSDLMSDLLCLLDNDVQPPALLTDTHEISDITPDSPNFSWEDLWLFSDNGGDAEFVHADFSCFEIDDWMLDAEIACSVSVGEAPHYETSSQNGAYDAI
eukprot:Gb_41401 [translate_table: standard]